MSPKKLPDDVYAALLAEADVFTRDRVLREGSFFCNELSAHLAQRFGEEGQAGIGPTVLERLLEDLRAEHFGTKEGYSRHGIGHPRRAGGLGEGERRTGVLRTEGTQGLP
jgi:hypothetical protein